MKPKKQKEAQESSAMTSQPPESVQITLAEYEALIALPENTNKVFEWVDGEIAEKTPSFVPSKIAGWVLTFINIHLIKNPIGYVTGEQGGYRLSEDTLLIPDVGYISKARLPEMPEREVLVAPDLAVEVKSPSDSKRAMRQKAERYLKHGTSLVWLVFPEEQRIEVYVPNQDVIELGLEDTLDGGEVLPSFTLAIKELFS